MADWQQAHRHRRAGGGNGGRVDLDDLERADAIASITQRERGRRRTSYSDMRRKRARFCTELRGLECKVLLRDFIVVDRNCLLRRSVIRWSCHCKVTISFLGKMHIKSA